jgi:hypothetical protein
VLARIPWAALAAGPLCAATLLLACAIGTSGDCSENGTCPGDETGLEAGIDAVIGDEPVESALAEGPGADAADGGVDEEAGCDPTKAPKDEPCLIDDSYGVFVAPPANGGDDTSGAGTQAKPYASLGKALMSLGGKTRVYVCNGTYLEQVALSVGASLYGGLACPGDDAGPAWSYLGGAARVNSPSSDYAIKIDRVPTAISIEDMTFTSSNAVGQDSTANGRSSIAAWVNGSAVNLTRVALAAGSGSDGLGGTDGATASNYAGTGIAPSGFPGGTPGDGGTGNGAGGSIVCANGNVSQGGAGGAAGSTTTAASGGDGQSGSSVPAAAATSGQDGSGGRGGLASCGTSALPGANGAPGANGVAAATYGSLSDSGWLPSGGSSGQAGAPGQGGGGGGGLTGVGGSGGGAGGCGGGGGSGGRGGGGSIALASVASRLILDHCVLTTSAGGNGGLGGNGENGQGGGGRGANQYGCVGAAGGNGAGGSGGAGGTGGISVAIAYVGASPGYDGHTVITLGAAGARGMHGMKGNGGSKPGSAGNAGSDGDEGRPGVSQAVLGP